MQHCEGFAEKEPPEEGGTSWISGAQGPKPQQTVEAEADVEQDLEPELDVHEEAEEPKR